MPRNDNPFFDSMNNAIDNLVPLALKKWQIDQEKAIAAERLGIEEARWAEQMNVAKEKLALDNFQNKFKLAVQNGDQSIIKGAEASGELKKYLGVDRWPRKVMQSDPYGGTIETDQLEMPMSAEDKLLMIEAGRDRRLNERLDVMERGQNISLEKTLATIAGIANRQSNSPLTISDIKGAHGMELQGIKNQMLVEMAPDEQANFANLPPEQMLAALLAGKGKSLSPEKKQQYLEKLKGIDDYYGELTQKALGRKGAPLKPAKAEAPKEDAQVRRDKAVEQYLVQYGDKYDQEEIYKALRGQYSDDEIKRAWRKYRGK